MPKSEKALFTIGVFGVADKVVNNEIVILVNTRTDQEKQKQLAGLASDWPGKIVDLPGGTCSLEDYSLEETFLREVYEEIGCFAEMLTPFFGPFAQIDKEKQKRNLAFVCRMRIAEEPKPSEENSSNHWLTWHQLMDQKQFRLPGAGKDGRMAKMIETVLLKI